MLHKFFDKKVGLGARVNEELAQELHKSVINKFKRRIVYVRFKDNIRTVDLAEMELLSFKNGGVKLFIVRGRCFHQICLGFSL